MERSVRTNVDRLDLFHYDEACHLAGFRRTNVERVAAVRRGEVTQHRHAGGPVEGVVGDDQGGPRALPLV
jgi:hypothetical protein